MILNVDPTLATTTEGYGRTDAFGRISNAIARGDNPLPLIAPVSFPPMWGMEFTSLFHYNGNTNSVIMRNIGQSFGLGALLLDDNFGSTSNVFNLNKLEKLIYKIKVPEWNELMPEEEKLAFDQDHKTVMRGCEVYLQRCWTCHDSAGKRVGPNKRLIDHKVFGLKQIGTDPNHTIIQSTPVIDADGNKIPFRQALFTLTKNIKERYLELHEEKNPELQIGQRSKTLEHWGNFSVRGMEHFRDPFLGEDFSDEWLRSLFALGNGEISDERFKEIKDELSYMKAINSLTGEAKSHHSGYIAKDLAGAWASAPYLHNGSVPTLWHLLSKPEHRPRTFVIGCREFDAEKVGYVWNTSMANGAGCKVTSDHIFSVDERLTADVVINGQRASKLNKSENVYKFNHEGQTVLLTNGNGNEGHPFYVNDLEDRKALIQFLKMLRPPEEYSWKSKPWYKIETVLGEKALEKLLAAGKFPAKDQMRCKPVSGL